VLLAKIFLFVFVEPNVAYAAMAAISVGIRAHVMRRLGAPWLWIIVVQIYAVTVFEANAIRAGIAASMIIYGLYCLSGNRTRSAWVCAGLSPLVHLQSFICILPFAIAWGWRKYMDRSRSALLLVLLAMGVATWIMIASGYLTSYTKLTEYANRSSGSAGVNFTSVSALVFATVALMSRGRLLKHRRERLIWTSIVAATVPSLVLFVTATNVAALGDRAWQLSMVIVSSFLFMKWAGDNKRLFTILILVCLGIISAGNVTLRYPLSNFFSFILPHVDTTIN